MVEVEQYTQVLRRVFPVSYLHDAFSFTLCYAYSTTECTFIHGLAAIDIFKRLLMSPVPQK